MEYGIIDETALSLKYPRPVDAVRPTLEEALDLAVSWIKESAEEVSVTRARYSKRSGCMVEDSKYGCITIDASNVKEQFFG